MITLMGMIGRLSSWGPISLRKTKSVPVRSSGLDWKAEERRTVQLGVWFEMSNSNTNNGDQDLKGSKVGVNHGRKNATYP